MSISVLICDDLPSVQGMLRRMLERAGLGVCGVASSADEVMLQYEAARPDVVLLDYRMPGAVGLSVLFDLLALDPKARVVMFSGTGDPDVRAQALAAGAADWILKPLFPATFVARLREIVGRPGRDSGPSAEHAHPASG